MPDPVDDGPESDGCSLDFVPDADDELTASLRALFPDGEAHDRWQDVFKAGGADAS